MAVASVALQYHPVSLQMMLHVAVERLVDSETIHPGRFPLDQMGLDKPAPRQAIATKPILNIVILVGQFPIGPFSDMPLFRWNVADFVPRKITSKPDLDQICVMRACQQAAGDVLLWLRFGYGTTWSNNPSWVIFWPIHD